jgi:hypothetical protein
MPRHADGFECARQPITRNVTRLREIVREGHAVDGLELLATTIFFFEDASATAVCDQYPCSL